MTHPDHPCLPDQERNATVAVHADPTHVEEALERRGLGMSHLSIVAGAGELTVALGTVGISNDVVIRDETAIKPDKQVLIAHGTETEVAHAGELLKSTAAESVEVHVGEAQVVA